MSAFAVERRMLRGIRIMRRIGQMSLMRLIRQTGRIGLITLIGQFANKPYQPQLSHYARHDLLVCKRRSFTGQKVMSCRLKDITLIISMLAENKRSTVNIMPDGLPQGAPHAMKHAIDSGKKGLKKDYLRLRLAQISAIHTNLLQNNLYSNIFQ